MLGDCANCLGVQYDNWGRSGDCNSPIGYYTWLASQAGGGPDFDVTPYGTDWAEGPAPYPERGTAADPYNQLAWYENNTWAAYGQGLAVLPASSRYGRNTVASNIRADGSTNCTLLYNVPSATPETVVSMEEITPDLSAVVNTAQAVICEYPQNSMIITATIPAEAYNFTKGFPELVSNSSQLAWYAGAKSGPVEVTLENTGSMAEVVSVAPGGCCMTWPVSTCDISVVSISSDMFQVTLQSDEMQAVQYYVSTTMYGQGYCNESSVLPCVWVNSSSNLY